MKEIPRHGYGVSDMKKTTICIDPGITGAIAIISPEGHARVFDMPTMAKNSGNGQQVNPYELSRIIIEVMDSACDVVAYVERVNAMPGQGVTSMFSFGQAYGVIHGVLGALDIPVEFPTPQQWKKFHGLIGKPKDSARTLAIQKFPYLSKDLARKKDVGRADALLIGLYGGRLGDKSF